MRWRGAMSEVAEDSDDGDVAYISSDESTHGIDLAERLRVKPSRDIWESGDYILSTYYHIETSIHYYESYSCDFVCVNPILFLIRGKL